MVQRVARTTGARLRCFIRGNLREISLLRPAILLSWRAGRPGCESRTEPYAKRLPEGSKSLEKRAKVKQAQESASGCCCLWALPAPGVLGEDIEILLILLNFAQLCLFGSRGP